MPVAKLGVLDPGRIEEEYRAIINGCHYLCDNLGGGCPYWEWKYNPTTARYFKSGTGKGWISVSTNKVPEFIKLRFKLGV